MTSITIHRGTNQIGGCVTEICTGKARVFIDFGANLDKDGSPDTQINGLTIPDKSRETALFLTHYHGDHIGRLNEVAAEVPIYMGETAKAIQMIYLRRTSPDDVGFFSEINTFKPLDCKKVGDITVTPLMIDHSAFDAYMFVVEAGEKRILYTGDFRLHGYRGSKTPKMIKCYAKNIDYIICEGTTLSREKESKQPWSEYELKLKARELMKDNKYVFVLCSSTHIDRIGAFYNANPQGRMFICDSYQKEILDTVSRNHADKSSFYNYKNVYDYAPNLDDYMEEKGFCMLIRQGKFQHVLDKYKDRCLVIYSMWTGYLDDERSKNQQLCDYLEPFRKNRQFSVLHTSGHASPKDIKKIYETVNPKCGLIPIHTDAPDAFGEFVPNDKLVKVEDGEALEI